jgi:DNA-binding NtrC family response regulator
MSTQTETQVQTAESRDGRILVVDDEESICDLLELILEEEGYDVDTAQSKSSALEQFESDRYDVVLQDIKLKNASGIDLLEEYRATDSACRVIMITAYSTWESTVRAMRLGAFDYFKKPFDNDEIRSGIRCAIESKRVEDEHPADESSIFKHLIGDSDALKEIRKTVYKVSSSNVTVLVCGESGSGKELVARSIHHMSPRKSNPFMSINCGAFPESLLESELFGHKKGSFTGAHEDKQGVLSAADKGTLLLDEIGEMPPEMQVKLLRVLENNEFKPVGGVDKKRINIRFIAATNKDIEDMVERGEFREDLYYRLNVIHITIPPLRERGEDILLLAGHFLSQYTDQVGSEIDGFTEEAKNELMSYEWPGNVRELKNAVRRAVALCDGEKITPELLFQQDKPERRTATDIQVPEQGIDLEDKLETIEKEYIRCALDKTNYNITDAADYLGISFRSLRYKIDKFDIETN